MNDDFRQQLYENLNQKETDELIAIWKTNDHATWSDLAFDVIREILQARIGELPPQSAPKLLDEAPDTTGPDWSILKLTAPGLLILLFFSLFSLLGPDRMIGRHSPTLGETLIVIFGFYVIWGIKSVLDYSEKKAADQQKTEKQEPVKPYWMPQKRQTRHSSPSRKHRS